MNGTEEVKVSFKDFLKTSLWVLKIYWGISKAYLLTVTLASVIVGVRGTALAFVFARILDLLVDMGRDSDYNFS